jgi:membrane protease YdiL (CAAX protease family)
VCVRATDHALSMRSGTAIANRVQAMLGRILRPARPAPAFCPAWGPGMAIVWAVAITIAIWFAAFAARDFGLINATLPDGQLDPGALERVTIPLEIACVLLVASRLRTNPLKVLAFRRPVRLAAFMAIALATVVAMIGIVVAVAGFLEDDSSLLSDPNQKLNEQNIHHFSLQENLLVTGIFAPVAEEMLFRGLLLVSFFNTRLWFWGAAIITSMLFALLHNPTSMNMLYHAPYFVMGLCFAGALRYTGSLWVPIGLHVMKNVVAVLLITF